MSYASLMYCLPIPNKLNYSANCANLVWVFFSLVGIDFTDTQFVGNGYDG